MFLQVAELLAGLIQHCLQLCQGHTAVLYGVAATAEWVNVRCMLTSRGRSYTPIEANLYPAAIFTWTQPIFATNMVTPT